MDDFKQGAQTGGLREHGERMGFKYGGAVKNTSSEFVMKKGPQDDMDTGTQPARKGRNEAEVEAGGTKKMLPGYKTGGRAKGTTKAAAGGYMEGGDADGYSRGGRRRKKAYKAKGGLATAQEVMDKHVKAKPPKGHGVKSGMKKGGNKVHRSTPMYGK